MAIARDLSAREERTVAELFRTRRRGHTCDPSDIDLDVRKLEQERRNVTSQQQPASVVVPHQPAVRRGLRAWLEQNSGLWAGMDPSSEKGCLRHFALILFPA